MDTQIFAPERMPPRDECGECWHPDLRIITGADEAELDPEAFRAAGFDLKTRRMRDDPDAETLNTRYENGDPALANWEIEAMERGFRPDLTRTQEARALALVSLKGTEP